MANLAVLNKSPTYSVTLPASKKTIKYRPYTVAEQKILLVAKEENTKQDILNAIRTVVKDCTFGVIDINSIPTFETELLLLNIRSRAVSSTIDMVMTCIDCDGQTDISIKVDDIKVVGDIKDDVSIKINDDLYVVMTYPTVLSSSTAASITNDSPEQTSEEIFSASLDLMLSCIKSIVSGDDVFETKDQTREELVAFIDTLMESQINEMKTFIETCPTVMYRADHNCSKCAKVNDTYIGGLENFFG